MFFPGELKSLKLLVNETHLSDHFNDDEIAAFQNAAVNIKDDLFIPRHKRKLTIVRLKKLIDVNFNLYETTKSILEGIRGKTEIRIGKNDLIDSK